MNGLEELIINLPSKPGVYQFLNKQNHIIYIGKAKNLKKRVSQYFKNNDQIKSKYLVPNISKIEYLLTQSETNALLLESELIKKHQPKYNVLLKDDKSFPYIQITKHKYPQLLKYRGKVKTTNSHLFGPFTNSKYLDTTIKELQKIFKLRSCSDSFFANRKRPCMQYQIGLCSAPCVSKISDEMYNKSVQQVMGFLNGKIGALQEELTTIMKQLSKELKFEEAAKIRDKIKIISYVQLKSGIASKYQGKNIHCISLVNIGSSYCVATFMYQFGIFCGDNYYFFEIDKIDNLGDILARFIINLYSNYNLPDEIIINYKFSQITVVTDALKKIYKKSCLITTHDNNHTLLINSYNNGLEKLRAHLYKQTKNQSILQKIKSLFKLPNQIDRIEVYDNSHISGKFAVGAMIVASDKGLQKNEYRRFNLSIESGDDYLMMRSVLQRRFKRFLDGSSSIPDLMIIDGGKGHMNVILDLMQHYKLNIPFICMSKGENRNIGLERFYTQNQKMFTLDNNSDEMKYLQILRDEAHNFAIKSHRKLRSRSISISKLDNIPGIGRSRKSILLNYFGSYEALCNSNIDELCNIPGISKSIAMNIINFINQN
ncbi:MAG: excinuclease ABC subunit UvrC [Rickettsiaceae bacterium]